MTESTLQSPELAKVEIQGTTRGAFLLRGTLAAGAAFGTAAISPFVRSAFAQSDMGDLDILNYALTLEYLEAAFYEEALQKTSGLGGDAKEIATRLGQDESDHVDALTAAIKEAGGKPVAAPMVDFGDAFASQSSFLKLAQTFEDTGVSAYNGAAPMIKSVDVLAAAGSIVQIEARHAALIRLLRDANPAPEAFDRALRQDAVLAAVKPFVKS